MSFPLRVGDHRIADPPALAAAVRRDAALGGGTLLRDQRPRQWVPAMVATRVLPADLAVALVAALLQDPSPATLVECAHIARSLGEPRLGAVLSAAVEAHDVGVLLVPGEEGRSVEDVLLLAAAELSPASDDTERRVLLERLRHAGLPAAEIRVLARGGSAAEVRAWLPALLQEDLQDGAALAALLAREATRDATAEVLLTLTRDERRALWDRAREEDRRVAVDVQMKRRLFPSFDR